MLVEMTSCPHCGGGNNTPCFAIFDDGYKCFSCGKNKASKILIHKNNLIRSSSSLTLPEHESNPNKFSVSSLKWLLKYFVDNRLILKNHIKYCHPVEFITRRGVKFSGESLIFPVIKNNEIVAYQRRFLDNKQFLSYGLNKEVALYGDRKDGRLVIVEDFISAIRVAEHCDVLCLFGTENFRHSIDYISENYVEFLYWLDNDTAGIHATDLINNALTKTINDKIKKYPLKYSRNYKLHAIINILKKDPKEFTDYEIKERLC